MGGPALNVNPHVMHESYSHEVSSAGFWPGNATRAAGVLQLRGARAAPGSARRRLARTAPSYSPELGEFVLPYAVVQASDRPDDALLEFLQTTYAAAADLGSWDRVLLEERPPCVCNFADDATRKE